MLSSLLHVTMQYTHLTDTGADLGFSGSTIVSVIMVAGLLIPELPKPPKPGAFLPARSASRLACCSSLAFRLISAFASRSWVWCEENLKKKIINRCGPLPQGVSRFHVWAILFLFQNKNSHPINVFKFKVLHVDVGHLIAVTTVHTTHSEPHH